MTAVTLASAVCIELPGRQPFGCLEDFDGELFGSLLLQAAHGVVGDLGLGQSNGRSENEEGMKKAFHGLNLQERGRH